MLRVGEDNRGALSGTGESSRATTGRVGVFAGRGIGRGRGTGRGVGMLRAGEEDAGGVLGIFSRAGGGRTVAGAVGCSESVAVRVLTAAL